MGAIDRCIHHLFRSLVIIIQELYNFRKNDLDTYFYTYNDKKNQIN